MKKPTPLDGEGNPLPHQYDPADFLVAPSDARGISYRLSFRVAPDFARAIDQILSSNRFPVSSRGDVLRFCTREGIRIFETLEPVISVSKRIDMLSMILTEEKSHAEFISIFDQLQETINMYIADQAPEQAVRVVLLARHQFDMMPTGHWRDKYLHEIHKRYADLLASASGTGSGVDL